MRGEDLLMTNAIIYARGSPPHAWGRRFLERAYKCGIRFTPTCVGKTHHSPSGIMIFTVHPHMRGEDGMGCGLYAVGEGSPPHAWGRHDGLHRLLAIPRFTPTCVGKTNHLAARRLLLSVHPHMRGEDIARLVWES